MEDFLPSEIARLVLGYLNEVDCTKSWQVFLEESVDLQEYCRLFKQKKNCSTNVQGESLLDILKAYRALKSFFEQIICQYSWKAILEDITYLQEHYSLYKQKTHCPVYRSGQSVVDAVQEWASKIPSKEKSKSSTSIPCFYGQFLESHPSSVASTSEAPHKNIHENSQNDQSNPEKSDKNIQTDQSPVSCHQDTAKNSNTHGVGDEHLQTNGVNYQFSTEAVQKDTVVSDTLCLLDKQNEDNDNISGSKDSSETVSSVARPETVVSATPEKITNNRFEEVVNLPHENNSSSSRNIQFPGTPFKLDHLENMKMEEMTRHPEFFELLKYLSSNRNCTETNNSVSANNTAQSTDNNMLKQIQLNDCGETNKINYEDNKSDKNCLNTVELDLQSHAVSEPTNLPNHNSSSQPKSNDNTSLESENPCDVRHSETSGNVLHVIDPLEVTNIGNKSVVPISEQPVSVSTEIKNASYENDDVPKKVESQSDNQNDGCATIIVPDKTDLSNVSANESEALKTSENEKLIIEESVQQMQETHVNKDKLCINPDTQVSGNNNSKEFSVQKDKDGYLSVQNAKIITQSECFRQESTENQFNKSCSSKENVAEPVAINQNNIQIKESTVQLQNNANSVPIQPNTVLTFSSVPTLEVPTFSTDWANNVQYRIILNTPLGWNMPIINDLTLPSMQPTIIENQPFFQSSPAKTAISKGISTKVENQPFSQSSPAKTATSKGLSTNVGKQSFFQSAPVNTATAGGKSTKVENQPFSQSVSANVATEENFQKVQSGTFSKASSIQSDPYPGNSDVCTMSSPHDLIIDASPYNKPPNNADKVSPSKKSKSENVTKQNLKKKCNKVKSSPGKKRFYPKRLPKRGPLCLFPSTPKTKQPIKVKEQSNINSVTDVPVLSISESPRNSALNVAAYEVVSKITDSFEEQCKSPVLRLLLSNASDLIKVRNDSKSSHVRNLNFNLNSTIKDACLDMPNINENNEVRRKSFENQNPDKMLKSPKKNSTQNSITKCDAQERAKTVTKSRKKNDSCKQIEDVSVEDVKNKVQNDKDRKNIKKDKSPKKNSKVKSTKSKSPKDRKKVTAAEKKRSKKESPITSKSKKGMKTADEIKKLKKGSQVTVKDSFNNKQNSKENVSDISECHSNKKNESFENKDIAIGNNNYQLCENILIYDNSNISKKSNKILESNQIHTSEKENSEKHGSNKENKSNECDEVQIGGKTKIPKKETILLSDKDNKLLVQNEKEERNNKFTTKEINNAKQIIVKKDYLEEPVSQIRRSKRIKNSSNVASVCNCNESSNVKQEKSLQTNNNHLTTPNKRKMSTPKKWTSNFSDISKSSLPNNANEMKQHEVPKPSNNKEVALPTGKEPAVLEVIEEGVEPKSAKSDLDNLSSLSSKNIHRSVDQDLNNAHDDISVVDLCSSGDEAISNSESDNFKKGDKRQHVSEEKKAMENDKTKLKNLLISFNPGKKNRVIKKSETLVQMKKTVFSGEDFSPEKACECDLQNSSNSHSPIKKSIKSRDNFSFQDNSSDTLPFSNNTLKQTSVAENSVPNEKFDIIYFTPSTLTEDKQNQSLIDSSGKKIISTEESNPLSYSKIRTPCKNHNLPASNSGENVFLSDKREENFVSHIKKSESPKSSVSGVKNKISKPLSTRCKHSRVEKSISKNFRNEITPHSLLEKTDQNSPDKNKNLKTYSKSLMPSKISCTADKNSLVVLKSNTDKSTSLNNIPGSSMNEIDLTLPPVPGIICNVSESNISLSQISNSTSKTSYDSSPVKTILLDHVGNLIKRANHENSESENKNGACAIKRKLSDFISYAGKAPLMNEHFVSDLELPLKKRSCSKLSSNMHELYSNTPKKVSSDTHQEMTDSFPNDESQDFPKIIKPASSSQQATSNSLVPEDNPKNVIGQCKRLQDSPVKSTNKIKKNNHKSALSKKIEGDPNIPAGVKIPSKWNSSKIITYSDEIRQSTKTVKKKEKRINPSGMKEKTTIKSSETSSDDKKFQCKPHVKISKLPKEVSTHNCENKFEENVEEKVVDLSINLESEQKQTVTIISEEEPIVSSDFSNTSHNLKVCSDNEKKDNKRTEDFIQRCAEEDNEERNDFPALMSSSKNEPLMHQSEESVLSSKDLKVPLEGEISESLEKTSRLQMVEALVKKFGYDYILNKLEDIKDITDR